MQVPLVLPTLQVSGVVDSSLVQHYNRISTIKAAAASFAGLPEHHWDLSDSSLASTCHRCSYNWQWRCKCLTCRWQCMCLLLDYLKE